MDIKEYVLNIVAKYQTIDPFEIARQKNIIVLFEDLGSTLGFYNTYKRLNLFILIIKLTKPPNDLFAHMN